MAIWRNRKQFASSNFSELLLRPSAYERQIFFICIKQITCYYLGGNLIETKLNACSNYTKLV